MTLLFNEVLVAVLKRLSYFERTDSLLATVRAAAVVKQSVPDEEVAPLDHLLDTLLNDGLCWLRRPLDEVLVVRRPCWLPPG